MKNFQALAKLLGLQQAQAKQNEDVYNPISDEELRKIAPSLFGTDTYNPIPEEELKKIAPSVFDKKNWMKSRQDRPVPPYPLEDDSLRYEEPLNLQELEELKRDPSSFRKR